MVDQEAFSARPYQVEILDHALKNNTIVCLGTGTGKTFISVMLIKEYAHQIKGYLADGGKRTFFLVPTVPLVYQQSRVIESHTNLKVGHYVGDMGVDLWTRKDWEEEFNKNQVLVMTAQILCDMLSAGHLSISNINVLLLDECHNATKNHVYVQIMKFFPKRGDPGPPRDEPRIMGLTASILNTKCKHREIGKIQDYINDGLCNLELTLRSVCVTCADPADVHAFAAKPNERVHVYDTIYPSNRPLDVFYHMQDILKATDNTNDRAHYKYSSSQQNMVEYYKSQLTYMKRSFELFAIETFGRIENITLGDDLVSRKVLELCRLLLESKQECQERGQELCAIVFTKMRLTAVVISNAINDIVKRNIEQYEGIWSDYILGHNVGAAVRLSDSAMSSGTQEAILRRFRNQEFNVLVSTSVIEEGLDVQKCNLVVKFDGIQTYREYAQSKGRARARPSNFVVMTTLSDQTEVKNNLLVMRVIERILQSKCQNREVPDDEDVKLYFQKLDELLPPVFGDGDDPTPRLTKDNAIQLLHQYCSKLSHDSYSNNQPHCCIRKVSDRRLLEEEWFVAEIKMPKTCPLKEKVTGERMPSRKMAKKSAAMNVCVKLRELEELDNRFLPVKIELPVEEEDSKGEKLSSGNGDIYPQKIPDCFQATKPFKGCPLYLYCLSMKLIETKGNEFFDHLLGSKKDRAFGLLMTKPFPEIPPVHLFTHAGIMEVTAFLVQEKICIRKSYLVKIEKFHSYIFDTLCPLFSQGKVYEGSDKLGILLCPLSVDVKGPFIDFGLLDCLSGGYGPAVADVIQTSYRGIKNRAKYFVLKSRSDLKPSSNYKNQTFSKYYQDLYGIHLLESYDFVEAYRIPSGKQYLVQNQGSERKGNKRIEILIREVCTPVPVPANLAFQAICLPAFFYRAVPLLLANELRCSIESYFNMKIFSAMLQGKTVPQRSLASGDEESPSFARDLRNYLHNMPFQALPKAPLVPETLCILTALTTKKALAGFDLERHEFLGDSYLKMIVSISVFSQHQNLDEGRLSLVRKKLVNNSYLKRVALKKGLEALMYNSSLSERAWMPPGFRYEELRDDMLEWKEEGFHFIKQEISDKSLADSIESLIGAFIVHRGCHSSLMLMEWFTLLPENFVFKNVSFVEIEKVKQLYASQNFSDFETEINYTFFNKAILVAAFTHTSYHSNEYSECYQRLEYLGDALLDFLVSYYLYFLDDNEMTPGEMTDLRSAVVNNNTFSLLAVKYKLDKLLLHSAPNLFKDIEMFVRDVSDDGALDKALKNPFFLSRGDSDEGIHTPKVLGDIFESLAGAIFLDSDLDIDCVWNVYGRILIPLIAKYKETTPRNLFREVKELFPYASTSYKETSSDKTECKIIANDTEFCGTGQCKSTAKSAASRKVLDAYRQTLDS